MLKNLIKKGPVIRAFFFALFIFLINCSSSQEAKKDLNFFSKKQASNVEIFTIRDFFTQGKFQLYFDVFNKNEGVTIGQMAIYVFNKDCNQVPNNAKSNKILYSNRK